MGYLWSLIKAIFISPAPAPGPSPEPPPDAAPWSIVDMITKAIQLIDDTIEWLEKVVAVTPTNTDNEYLEKLKAAVDFLKKALASPIIQQLLSFLMNHQAVTALHGDARNAAMVSLAVQNAGAYQSGVEAVGISWSFLLQVLPLVMRFLLAFAGKR